ncbi:MAG: GNAT family N-acetyltransferase [Pseudomonadota bacterium]
MSNFSTKSLNPKTWDAFAALVERHNGVWGGCWCMAFHAAGAGCEDGETPDHRQQKETLVRRGETHAALVFDGADCVGWCQFGSPRELPRIKSKRAYEEAQPVQADWRITCFFVDKARRKEGVAAAALSGALEQIAALGGGRVESFPEDTADRKVSSSFLHNGSLAMFELLGFVLDHRIGKHRWLVHRDIAGKKRGS